MSGRLSILAGGGNLVTDAIKAASADGWDVQVLSLVPRADLQPFSPIACSISNPVNIVMKLRQFKTSHICMVGGLTITDNDREGLFSLFRKKKSTGSKSGGDTGLSALIGALEFSTGAQVVGVHNIVRELVAGNGLIAGPKINSRREEDCKFALDIALQVGRLDIGQAVVCSGHRTIAVEDIAGTDALLARVSNHVDAGLTGDGNHPLIFAKAKKPNQPEQVDLPAIGPDTISAAHSAGISVIAVQAGSTLLIDKIQLIERAGELGVSVFGVEVT